MKTVYLSALGLALFAGRAHAADAPSYTKDVKPFIAMYCAECHGVKETKAGINLLSVDSMLKGGRKGKALVPESPEKSRMYQTMVGGGKQMPPKKFGKQPTKDEIPMIKAWIATGAKDDTEKASPEKKGDTESKEVVVPRKDDFDPHGADQD